MDANSLILKIIDNAATRVDRGTFLREVLFAYKPNLSQDKQQQFLENPVKAIGVDDVTLIADKIIKNAVWGTTSLSFLAGLPGGVWGVAAAAPDIVQNMRNYIVLSQKLAYIYGVNFYENANSSDEYRNSSTLLCLGFMLGANGVDVLIQKLLNNAWQNSSKEFVEYIMKTAGFAIAKKIAAKLGEKLTKKGVTNFVSKAVPVLGGIISGGLTYVSFKSAATVMQKKLIKYNNNLTT